MRKFRKEDFVERAKEIHGDKYDYSRTDYVNSRTKVEIVCSKHGSFWQTPRIHLGGHGCPKCKAEKSKERCSKSQEIFLKELRKVFNDRYDYSKVSYVNNKTKVEIICPKHGSFEIQPSHLLRGHGCPKCAGKNKTTEEFVRQLEKTQGDKYDYSKVKYKGSKSKITIICHEHGEFRILPQSFLLGSGCPKCAGRVIVSERDFIERAKSVFGSYDYSNSRYIDTKTKVEVVCPKHGAFKILPWNLLRGHGCFECGMENKKKSLGEQKIRDFLNSRNISFKYNKTFSDLKDKKFLSYDFYLQNEKIVIEYNGIQHYGFHEHFHKDYHEFLVQKHHDWMKRKYAEKNGLKLLAISYKEYEKIDKILEEKIDTSSRSQCLQSL